MHIINNHLHGIDRCPHCSVAHPSLRLRGQLDFVTEALAATHNQSRGWYWGTFICSSCQQLLLAQSEMVDKKADPGLLSVDQVYPPPARIDDDLPAKASRYLSQAIESLHAPDGAAMLAGSAVDAMLKEKGLIDGSLYARIDEAVTEGILTPDMGEWAHNVRLGSNRPRHADVADPHVTREEASQACDFVKTLGLVLFVLPARISRGKEAAEVDP